MRKRKSPIVLVTALVVLVAGVAGYNFASGRTGAPTPEQPTAPPVADDHKMLVDKRAPANTTDTANSVKRQMGSPSASPEAGKPMSPQAPGGHTGPMVLSSQPGAGMAPTKPKPNSTATSSQWYNDESANGSKKD